MKTSPADTDIDSPATSPAVELSDRLRVTCVLGEGGLGVVHEVVDANLNSTRALKTLHPRVRDDRVAQRLLLEEARITAQLDHPGIVPVHALGIDETGAILPAGSLYFTMKKVEGRTLGSLIADLGARPRTTRQLFDFLQILIKVCDAVAFAHSRGIIHRDLKPGNIMVGTFGEVFVMDWGVAKAPDSSAAECFAGTIAYMAPEQAREDHDATDARSDIFSLGAVLFEILSGRPPYVHQGGSTMAMRIKAMMGDVPDVRSVSSWDVPPHLAGIAMKALSRDAWHRHSSVADLKSDLEEFMRSGWQFPRRSFPAGSLVVVENEPGHSAYVIVQGRCLAFKIVDGQKLVLREMGEGDVFGETAVFSEQPRSATVEAIDDVVLMEFTADFFSASDSTSYWMGRFVKALAERFRERDARAAELEGKLGSPT